MKRAVKLLICFAVAFVVVLSFGACSKKDEKKQDTSREDTKKICGQWQEEVSGNVCEYTADGYYYEYINENFTNNKTKYELKDGKVYYYIDGEQPNEGIPYEFREDKLIIAGEIEYTRLLDEELLESIDK